MKFTTALAGVLAMGPLVSAHTLFARMFIDGESQGDGTCIRMPRDGSTATSPIKGLTSNDMACGADGEIAAAYVCPVSASATLTFEFREWPDARQGGAIDKSHRGPCSVYVKRLDDMFSDPAPGPGWTKIWHEGYDEDAARWCTEKLIENKGLLTVELPSGLPAGYYLVRPELLALHQAASLDDPQYYVGCAQIHIQDGPSDLSVLTSHAVSIPGHVDGSEPGNSFNVYKRPLPLPYEIPGPEPYSPVGRPSGSPSVEAADIDGAIPADCVVKNANWCGRPLEPYSGETPCWAAVEACFAQGSKCYDSTSPTGVKGCDAWNKNMCHAIQAECRAKDFTGPPVVEIADHKTPAPGPIPVAVNKGAGAAGPGGSDEEAGESATKKPAAATTAPATIDTPSPSSTAPIADDDDDTTTAPVYEVISSASPTVAASSRAPSVSAPPESDSGSLTVSPDGTCGGDSGYTCLGSRFGNCCSRNGRCGRRSRACGCHCQSAFGVCNEKSSA